MAHDEINNLHHHLSGDAIAKVLSSVGPVVKCVLLRATPTNGDNTTSNEATVTSESAKDDEDNHKSAATDGEDDKENDEDKKPEPKVLVDLIDEIEVDTTPSKSMVASVLGGSFTFLGQYDEEGIVLMVRKLDEDVEEILCSADDGDIMDAELLTEELQTMRLRDLKGKCKERGIDIGGLLEKGDFVRALRDSIQESFDHLPPLNPHQLQPPLDRYAVRGDILIMKVAETDEALDKKESNDEDVVVPTNDEFFLDYTKEEYIAFAKRTDIFSTLEEDLDEGEVDGEEIGDDDDEEDDDGDDDGEEDEDYSPLNADGDFDVEEEKGAMLNFVMGEVLKKFREENGRGPDTRELLELRSEIAGRVGVEVASADEHDTDWDRKANRKKKIVVEQTDDDNPIKSILTRKRSVSDDDDDAAADEPETKKVKFADGFESEAKEEEV